jgi:carnitine 3-dehydrogenase
VRANEAIHVTTQVLAVDDKRLHVFHQLYRSRDQVLIASGEQLHLHVNTQAAKASVMDVGIRAQLEAIRVQHAALPRPSSVGRHIGLKQGAPA